MKLVCKCGAESEFVLDGTVQRFDNMHGRWSKFNMCGDILAHLLASGRQGIFATKINEMSILFECENCGERVYAGKERGL